MADLAILGFVINRNPRDLTLQAYPLPFVCPAAVTTILNFPNLVNGIARSIEVSNNDTINIVTFRINGDRINTRTLGLGAFRTINDQWIAQIEVIAGAVGSVDVTAEIVPLSEFE